jgi:hypothetical protein
VDGKLTLAGVDASRLPAPRLLNVVYAILVDSFSGFVNTGDVISKIDASLSEPIGTDPQAPRRETWGTGPRAESGARGMMSLTGPPPAMPRPPKEEAP